jgi:hypothetical protein
MSSLTFSKIIESIYKLPLQDREELRDLLENNITESRRKEILDNYKLSKIEEKMGKLEFSSNIEELKTKL